MTQTEQPALRVGVLVSGKGRGSNLQAILDAIDRGDLHAEVAVVISTTAGTGALDRAREHGVPAEWVDPSQFGAAEEVDAELARRLETREVEIVCLAGFMRLLTPWFCQRFRHRIVNIHPALLPSFGGKGMYGHHVHEAVIASGVRITGVTIHFVDEVYDHGPIIYQRAVEVADDDTPETLAARVLKVEHDSYWRALQLLAERRVRVEGRRVRVLPSEAERG